MKCPKCGRSLVQVDYVEAQNRTTKWFLFCPDCDKHYVILGQVYTGEERNNFEPSPRTKG